MEIADRLAGVIADLVPGRPRLAVAFDGPDAAGKTTLAGRLRARLGRSPLPRLISIFTSPR